MKPCIRCGVPTPSTRCDDCAPTAQSIPTTTAAERGYDNNWTKLSRRARRLQPFCTDCGATDDLQADHTPEAWRRKNDGLPIRLQDIEVCCRGCNVRRGAARGGKPRGEGLPRVAQDSFRQAQRQLNTTQRSSEGGGSCEQDRRRR